MVRKKPDDPKSVRVPVTYMFVPRPWLIALAAVLIVPWLTVAAIWLWSMNQSGDDEDNATPATAGCVEQIHHAEERVQPAVCCRCRNNIPIRLRSDDAPAFPHG